MSSKPLKPSYDESLKTEERKTLHLRHSKRKRNPKKKMSCALRRNASITRLLQKQPFTDFTNPMNRIHPFLRNQTREYFRFPNVVRKVREYKIFSSLFTSSVSSTSTWFGKVGFVGWYLGMVKSWPVLTKSVTSSLIYMAADLSSQVIFF